MYISSAGLIGHYKQFKFEQAKLLYERALQIEEQALGPTHPDLARTLNNLAPIYVLQGVLQDRLELDALQGQLEQVESLLQRAIQIKEQTLGPMHLDVASSLSNLGTFYAVVRGKRDQAEPLMKRALDIYKLQLGSRHPRTLQFQRIYSVMHFFFYLKMILGIPRRMLQRLRHWIFPSQSEE